MIFKKKQSGNEVKQSSSVKIVKERSGKRAKNNKSCFELLISEYMLKTIIDFTSKTMERIKSKPAIDYRVMHPNIDDIRSLKIIQLLRGDYRDTKQILNKLGYSPFISRLFTEHVSTLNATNGV